MLNAIFGVNAKVEISKPYGVQVLWESTVYDLVSFSLAQPKIKQFELWPVAQDWCLNWWKSSQPNASVPGHYQKWSMNLIDSPAIWALTYVIEKWFGLPCHLVTMPKTV